MQNSPKITENRYLSNPFLVSFSITPRIISRKIVVEGRGTSYMNEAVDFCKFTAYENFPFKLLPELNKPALIILMHILNHLKWKQDYLEIRYYEKFNSEKPYELYMSKSSFYAGINTLIQHAIIAKRLSRDKTYWINPSMFFLGNRLATFPDNIREGKYLRKTID